MKMQITSVWKPAITILLFSCSHAKYRSSIYPGNLGDNGNIAGMAILNEKDFIFVATFKPDSAFSDSLTADEIVDRYNTMNVIAGTHTIGDSIVNCTTRFHKDPNQAGKSWRWRYALNGDDIHWEVIDDDGAVTGEGNAKRVKN
jgi:hypothetical protein